MGTRVTAAGQTIHHRRSVTREWAEELVRLLKSHDLLK